MRKLFNHPFKQFTLIGRVNKENVRFRCCFSGRMGITFGGMSVGTANVYVDEAISRGSVFPVLVSVPQTLNLILRMSPSTTV